MPTYRGVTKIQIRSGKTALFWKDDWCIRILEEQFPRAFSYTLGEDASVRNMLTIPEIGEAFHLPLSTQAHDELRRIQNVVSSTELSDERDIWTCTWGSSTFKTTPYYKFCFRELQVHEAFHWLWKAKSVPKIKNFGWFLLVDRLNTRNMLSRRHYNIGTNLDCLLCGEHVEETLEHLFFRCTFSTRCWLKLNITWPATGDRLHLLKHLKTGNQRKMLMDTFLVAAWSLWKERNNNYFRHVAPSVDSWLARFRNDFANIVHRLPVDKRHLISAILASIP